MSSTTSTPGASVFVPSNRVVPSTVRRKSPAPEKPTAYVPASVARSTVCTSTRATASSPSPKGPNQKNAQPGRCSVPRTAPSASRKRTSTPSPLAVGQPRPRRTGARDARARRDARGVLDLRVAEGAADPVERRHRVRRVDGRAAAPERAGDRGVRSQHRDARGALGVEREDAVVAREDEAGGGDAAQLGRDLRVVIGRRRHGVGAVEHPDPGGEAEQPQDLVVDRRLGHATRADGRHERVVPRADRPRHDQAEPRVRGRLGRARREPVRHHDAVEPPLAHEEVALERVLGHRGAVDAVVGRHDRPHAGLPHDRLERREVDLAQRALADADVHGHPLGLRVVPDEVLDRGADAALLHAAHVRGADPGGQVRILAQVLEVPPAVRRAVQVDRRGEQDVDALAPRLVRQQQPEPVHERLVPRRGERGRRRHVGRGVALVPRLAADARRPVGDDEPAQAGVGLLVQRPEVRAREQPDLLLERELRDPIGEIGLLDRGRQRHAATVRDSEPARAGTLR